MVRNAHVIVSETTRIGKLQGICHLNTPCFAYFNPPSTSQRSNILLATLMAFYVFPWLAGLLTRSLITCALGWGENLRWNFKPPSFCGINHIWNFRCRFSLRGSPSFFAYLFRLRFSPTFFACVFRLSFRFSFRLNFLRQAVELVAACSARALTPTVPFSVLDVYSARSLRRSSSNGADFWFLTLLNQLDLQVL